MPVPIHGKQYMTVAERVNDFRVRHPMFTIETQLIQNDEQLVVMKALILEGELLLATGYAEERRNSTQINKTSALENCETSAIGRALAAFGLGGTEYASANEVENAIHQQTSTQVSPEPIRKAWVDKAVQRYRELLNDDDMEDADKVPEFHKVNDNLTNDERIAVGDRFGTETWNGTRKHTYTIIKEFLREAESEAA